MDDLNKQQLVLLALLVSFVSSIATGIVTVTLMQQAPKEVGQTISKVIERTIETVVPIKGPNITETTIIKEEDFVVSAIERNKGGIVLIRPIAPDATLGEVASFGLIFSNAGNVVTDASSVSGDSAYVAELPNGTIVSLARVVDGKSVSIFELTPKKDEKVEWQSVLVGKAENLKVGQSVVSFGSRAGTGIISELVFETEKSEGTGTTTPRTETKKLSLIKTSTNSRDDSGSAVIALDGGVIGVVAFRAGERVTVPTDVIVSLLESSKKKAQ